MGYMDTYYIKPSDSETVLSSDRRHIIRRAETGRRREESGYYYDNVRRVRYHTEPNQVRRIRPRSEQNRVYFQRGVGRDTVDDGRVVYRVVPNDDVAIRRRYVYRAHSETGSSVYDSESESSYSSDSSNELTSDESDSYGRDKHVYEDPWGSQEALRRVIQRARTANTDKPRIKISSKVDMENEQQEAGDTSEKEGLNLFEHNFANRMEVYLRENTKNVGIQMNTQYIVPKPPEPPVELKKVRDVLTQTKKPKKPPKLDIHRYETAIIEEVPKPPKINEDDEIEVIVNREPEEQVQYVRQPSGPGPILMQHIDLRPPLVEIEVPVDFGPPRKYKPPPPKPPQPDAFVRVGGGWMKKEHHGIQHRHCSKSMTFTGDGLPFMKSSFTYHRDKNPTAKDKPRKRTLRYASFI